MHRPAIWLAAAVLLCGFAAPPTPRQAAGQLDPADPKYASPDCAKARAAAQANKKHPIIGAIVGIGGNIAAPFAGAAASAGLNYRLIAKQNRLSRGLAIACTSDPLGADKPDVAAN